MHYVRNKQKRGPSPHGGDIRLREVRVGRVINGID